MKHPSILLHLAWLGSLIGWLDVVKVWAVDTDNDDDDDEREPSTSKILLAHTLIDSSDASNPQKAGGLPQTISVKKAFRLLEKTPLRYYTGTPRARMHLTHTSNDPEDFYVWYAWKGPDVQRDGYYLQVFQVRPDAAAVDIVKALHQFGELDGDNPFVTWNQATLWQYLYDFSKQKEAQQTHGLLGAHVYLHPWKRIYQDGVTAEELSQAADQATLAASEPAGWLKGGTRLRILEASNDTPYGYIVIEEDSDLGHLYDACVGWVARLLGDDRNWGKEWGRHAIYKFAPNATSEDRMFAIRTFQNGRLETRKRVDRLMEMIWPVKNDAEAVGKEDTGKASSEADNKPVDKEL